MKLDVALPADFGAEIADVDRMSSPNAVFIGMDLAREMVDRGYTVYETYDIATMTMRFRFVRDAQ